MEMVCSDSSVLPHVSDENGALDLKHAIVDNQRPQTPPSAAVNAVSISATPHFNPTVYKAQKEIISENKGDSFVANIESRTPAKTTGKKSTGNNGNSFIGQIKSRSPGRRISRIEDSVEALDALDEEIEKVGKLITTADGPQAPGKAKKQAKPPLKAADKKPNASMRAKYGPLTQTKPVDKRFASIRKPAAPRPSIQSMAGKDITSKKRLSIEKLSTITKSPAATHSSGNHVPPAATKKRVSSVHKAPFQTVKSTKPPTRSTFELPGEAVARKLKEQREERVKRDEEGKSKQRTTKARPVRLSQAPEVRQTATTKARLSMAQGGPATGPKAGEASTKAKPFLVGENKRTSSLSVAKRTPAPKPSANSSARVTRAPSLNVSQSGSRNPSTSGAKGKEVFSRTRIEIQEREKAKKEKEDAAKKARIEAAERGRVASREWAEKQKLRKDAQKANTEGKAVSAA